MSALRAIVLTTSFAALCPFTPSDSAAAIYEFVEKGGVVSIEAEHFSSGRSYIEVAGKSGKAMQLPQCAVKGGGCPMGYLRYNIGFTKAGKYTIWLLCRSALDSHGNEFQARIDTDTTIKDPLARGNGAPFPESSPQHLAMMPIDQKDICFTRMRTGEDGDKVIAWRSMAKSSRPVQGTMPVTPMRFNVKTPGMHHIEFIPGNEHGWAIDKIVLTLDGTKPSAAGPAETVGPTAVGNSGMVSISTDPRKGSRASLSLQQHVTARGGLGLDGRISGKTRNRTVIIKTQP